MVPLVSGPFNPATDEFLAALSLINNNLNLPFGPQEGHGSWNFAYRKQWRWGGGDLAWELHRAPFSFMTREAFIKAESEVSLK